MQRFTGPTGRHYCAVSRKVISCAGPLVPTVNHTADLILDVDFDGPIDVLVSEIVSNNMVGEGVLPAMEQAARRLVRPDAQIIPARGIVRVALAEDRDAHRQQVGMVEGFDLSRFNRLATPSYPISVGKERLMLRSEPGDLFRFDFQSRGPFPEATGAVGLSASGGIVNGIAQWIRLEMDADGWYENRPAVGTSSAWAILFYPLQRPIEVEAADKLTVCGEHDRQSLRIWANLRQSL